LNAITNHFSQSEESGRFIESRHLDSKRVLIRNLSRYCESCIAADGVEPCLNLAQVGNSDETVLRISPGPNNDQETDRDDTVEEQTESVADLMFPVNPSHTYARKALLKTIYFV
jgi:hypothetical protein